MNKKLIYLISAVVMLVVAISIGFIFTSTSSNITPQTSQDPALESDDANAVIEPLKPAGDLILQAPADDTMVKPPRAVGIADENKNNEKKFTSIEILDELTFSSKKRKEEGKKVKVQEDKRAIKLKYSEKNKEVKKDSVEKDQTQVSTDDNGVQETATGVKDKEDTRKILVTKSGLEPKAGTSTITYTELRLDGDQVKFLIEGDHKIKAQSFILEKPDRVVFDIEGEWRIMLPKVTSNRMVKEMRLGKTKTHTRIVFDLNVEPRKPQVKQLNPKQVQLIFR